MKLYSILSLLALAAAPALANASTPILIDFENNWQYGETVDNHYAASGVTFSNVLGLSNDADFTYYTGAPSAQGVAMAQLDGEVNTSAFLNVDSGAVGGLSFFYSSPTDVAAAIKVYSGLNGTGTLLGTIDLVSNASAYDVWTQVNFSFNGVAKSFDLTGTANVVGLDNISIAAVPEPESYALALMGLGVLGLIGRRASRK